LRAELLFYLVTHDPAEAADSLRLLYDLLQNGVRSPGWDFESDIAWAERHGDPRVDMLRTLSKIISGTVSFDQMERHTEWHNFAD
jgi:hypothetical protein